jgi:hypothetical protein
MFLGQSVEKFMQSPSEEKIFVPKVNIKGVTSESEALFFLEIPT